MTEAVILLPILLGFIGYQFFKAKKQNRKTLLAQNIFFLIVWPLLALFLQIAIEVFIFDWTEAGQNLFDKLENIIGGILIYVPWYWYSWYLWFRRPKNIRFELKKDEKILLLKPRAYWFSIRHVTNFGTIYFTDKRIAFCATPGWKFFLFVGPFLNDPFTQTSHKKYIIAHLTLRNNLEHQMIINVNGRNDVNNPDLGSYSETNVVINFPEVYESSNH